MNDSNLAKLLIQILELLEGLSPEERQRVVESVNAFYSTSTARESK